MAPFFLPEPNKALGNSNIFLRQLFAHVDFPRKNGQQVKLVLPTFQIYPAFYTRDSNDDVYDYNTFQYNQKINLYGASSQTPNRQIDINIEAAFKQWLWRLALDMEPKVFI